MTDEVKKSSTFSERMSANVGSGICAQVYTYFEATEVQRLVKYCGRNKLPLLLDCDANAHCLGWGRSDNNPRGECLLEFFIKENIHILNVGNTPTFVTTVREEVLGITLGSPRLRNCITG